MKFRQFLCGLLTAALLFSALPAALAADAAAFTDAKDIRHLEAVTAVVKLGLMSGKEDGGYFDPEGNVTRGEAAKMMTLLLTGGKGLTWEFTPASSFSPDFSDELRGHWAELYIRFCAERGLAFAQEDGRFDPNGNITFFELLRMVEIALGRLPKEFTESAYWMVAADTFALHRGLFTGLDDFQGKALVDHPVTRDEAAQILYNALNATPEVLEGSSTGFFEDVKRPDGTPSTLLYECYGLGSWDELDAWLESGTPKPSIDADQLSDAAQISHWEAAAALCRLGVVSGRDDGAFHPGDTVTRAEAAKLIALIMCGGIDLATRDSAEDGFVPEKKDTPSFSDTEGHWAEAYIEYCADLKIISGRGDGTFDPDGEVTGMALVKMALCALGYDADAYRLNGLKWDERADELARSTDPSLYNDLVGTAMGRPITRDDAAQILYNALMATPMMVKPEPQPDGTVAWRFAPAASKDGTPRSLLQERFNLTQVGDLPAQPVKR